MKILVTGAAGFIGYHLCEALIKLNHSVVGLDNINDYYSVDLKYDRLKQLGIVTEEAGKFHQISKSSIHGEQFQFIRMNLEDRDKLPALFKNENFGIVCNLAAQAGVRYSLENPESYIDSNVVGFLNILECCKKFSIKHLLYASSSSVYGLNKKIPFETSDRTDQPISLYAASKKSNELMAFTYSHLYKIPTTGLRFFTVYGPWGRPDMAIYIFADAIANKKPINVFNQGKLERDFTFIGDIVEGLVRIIEKDVKKNRDETQYFKLYNIGNSNSVKLMDFIKEIEVNLNKKAEKVFLPMQPGDVERTWANVDELIKDYDYSPNTPISQGVKSFVEWYIKYHQL
ncbi:NAD-dependent epimerase/dehydratase family protein [Flagellimonas sp.]|uniref:NAD-dependent epimerase/dehydratase family protein n=1 Tax=Flagellimonas sp. TaxID=2058762 RepID=UPI003B5A75AA